MTTVLSVGGIDSERRCDARCHDATTAFCDCICGGRYHGAGTPAVLEHVRKDVAWVFVDAAPVFGRRHLAETRALHPQRIRFHARGVERALRKLRGSAQLPIVAGSGSARSLP